MEPKFNTSFIPKKSLQADVGGSGSRNRYVGRREIRGPGFYLMLMIFLLSVVASLIVFAYTKIVENNIQQKITRLEQQKDAFDQESVDLLIRADLHITNAKRLLMNHIAVSEVFSLLELVTLKRIQYNYFEYTGAPEANALATISGTAKNFQDVALQTEQYRVNEYMYKPAVNELERLLNNTISFSVDVTLDQRLLSFREALQGNRFGQPTNVPVSTEPAVVAPETEATTTLESTP